MPIQNESSFELVYEKKFLFRQWQSFCTSQNFFTTVCMLKCCNCSIAWYGAETCTLLKVNQKYQEGFEMWCWGRMEISWTNRVRNEEIFHTLMEERNIPDTINSRKANWIGHTLQKICLLKHIIEWKIEGMGRWGRRYTQLLEDLKEKRWYQ